MTPAKEIRCPHCGIPMSRWANPEGASWSGEFQYVCFNDDCLYFVNGWEWMRSQYNVSGSYRHRLDPETGQAGPLPVWSAEDFRTNIIPDPQEGPSDAL